MKKLLLGLAIIMTMFTITTFAGDTPIKVTLNGEPLVFDVNPVIIEDRILVPLRAIFEAFGGKVEWIENTGTIIGKKESVTIELQKDETLAIVNGNSVTLDVPAQVIDSRIVVPLRFISENLGATVVWNDSNRVVTMENEKKADIEKLSKKVIFENDIRYFTLFAFMNYTGYNDENNSRGFNPVRKMIREEMASRNILLTNNNYYREKNVPPYLYVNALRELGWAPGFKRGDNQSDYVFTSLRDLPERLEEFYQKADIENLFLKYKPYYDADLEKYKCVIYPAIVRVNQLLKVDIENVPVFYVQVNLLDAYWRGYGGSVDKYKGFGVITTGPSIEPNIVNIVHEYLHGVINPITDELKEEIDANSKIDRIPQNSEAIREYKAWNAIVNESIIRAFSRKAVLDFKLKQTVKNEVDNGYIMTQYFYDRIDEFSDYNGDLKSYIKKLIHEYN